MAAKKTGLGRGLEALFSDNAVSSPDVVRLSLSEIEPNRDQPRKAFEPEALSELADSIRRHGVLQPLLVRPQSSGGYQIIAGERRWRAARLAGQAEVPVIVMDVDPRRAQEIALIENLQREDLDPVEEAEGFRDLIERHNLTQEQVAEAVGRSRPAVANSLRLLSLPEAALKLLRRGDITAGHARAILSVQGDAQREAFAARVTREKMTVREAERQAAATGAQSPGKKPPGAPHNPSFYREVELALREELGRRVTITAGAKGGTLALEFLSKEELADYARRLARQR